MNLKIGIVGLPNAGKSTLFNALLKRQVAEAANYPFTTIEPNIGVVPVPDDRLEKLAQIVEAEEGIKPPFVPAIGEFVDIAELVKGASEGQGLGNKFLSHIREVDIICNVVRVFPDPDVIHVAGSVDAKRDREIIETELILADLQTLEKQVEPRGKKDPRWDVIVKLKDGLNQGNPARDVVSDERELVKDLHLLSMKPILYVENVSENQLGGERFKISAKVEAELASLTQEEQKEYLKSLGLEASGLDRLIQKAYELLELISFLTCGVKEVRAWTIKRGTLAPQAAGVIHTDFEKKFIKADVVSFDEFEGWKKAREVGKVRSEGKGYIVQDGDVIEFKVGA